MTFASRDVQCGTELLPPGRDGGGRPWAWATGRQHTTPVTPVTPGAQPDSLCLISRAA